MERSSKFRRQIEINLTPYYEIEKQLEKESKQRLITDITIAQLLEECLTKWFLRNDKNFTEEIYSD